MFPQVEQDVLDDFLSLGLQGYVFWCFIDEGVVFDWEGLRFYFAMAVEPVLLGDA